MASALRQPGRQREAIRAERFSANCLANSSLERVERRERVDRRPEGASEQFLLIIAVLSTSVAIAQSTSLVRSPQQVSANVTSVAQGPAWRGLSTVFDAHKYDINGFPTANEFGGNATGTIQTFVGSINVDSSSTATNHGAGGFRLCPDG